MKHITTQKLLTLLPMLAAVLVLAVTSPALAQDAPRDTMMTGAQWEAFNESLVDAIHSDHEGSKMGALKQIAMYGEYMDWPELTIIEVVRTSREADDTASRRLAVVAAANMGSGWAIEYYDMLSRYEEDPAVKQTMEAVVREAHAND